MADLARSRFLDTLVDHPFRRFAPAGMPDYLAFWRLGHLETWMPPAADFAALTQGVPGRQVDIVSLYCQLDASDDEVWFLEYRVTIDQRNGARSSFRWFDERMAGLRWIHAWHPLRERAMQRRTLDTSFALEEVVDSGDLEIHLVKEKLREAGRMWEGEPKADVESDEDLPWISCCLAPLPEVCTGGREMPKSERAGISSE